MTPSTMAADIANSTVPAECQTICSPVVQLVTTCNVDMSSMKRADTNMVGEGKDTETPDMPMRRRMDIRAEADKAQMDCICNNKSFDVGNVMALCSSCMGQNAGTGESFSNFLFANGKLRHLCLFI